MGRIETTTSPGTWSRLLRQMIAAALMLEGPNPGETTRGRALLTAIGGIRGCLQALLPGLMFLGLYIAGAPRILALIFSATIAATFVVTTLTTKAVDAPALLGLAGVIVPVVVAVTSGHVIDSYLPHLITHALSAATLLGSVVMRWPAVGIAAGVLLQHNQWRNQQPLYGRLRSLTLLWAGVAGLRLIIELPIYLAHQTTALIITTLVLGLPLTAPLAVHTWWTLRSIINAATIPTRAPQSPGKQ